MMFSHHSSFVCLKSIFIALGHKDRLKKKKKRLVPTEEKAVREGTDGYQNGTTGCDT